MGIQGLLPLLRPIQRHRHLSEFAGQTLAVDAYVWLHRGAYACAAELVQGRPTRRYIDFCMARVRLLRHYGIAPYLVFDGGPLPAKLGTEKEREKKRAENIKRANELMGQGKESQAREYYVKCVDVTPQMAYQVIKALKAENVPYVVAPYEADAQLAYLERTGFVDGIITEDSDLLVFGCRNVHLKLDTASASLISISRVDFGSPALAADSFSLIGWSDAQFRWMAMLSGCDYLPSIAGVGLKTAYQLLKKYKSVDRVVKMIRLEGKKVVPKGYLDAFYLAEKVFLHQRVFDPRLKELVYLTSPSDDFGLSQEVEMYIGRHLEPSLATRIAEGDMCPISLADMDDINTAFVPRTMKALPLQKHDTNSSRTPRGKMPAEKKGGILNFFTPVSKPLPVKEPPSHSTHLRQATTRARSQVRAAAGNASGKRTLVDVMEHDIVMKRKKVSAEAEADRHRKAISSSGFSSEAGPSRVMDPKLASHTNAAEKENDSLANGTKAEEFWDLVTQEDGYLSPSPSLSRGVTPDLSSPILSRGAKAQYFPEASKGLLSQDMPMREVVERVFVRGSSEPIPDCDENVVPGPNLTTNLAIEDDDDLEVDRRSEPTSEILCWEDDHVDQQEEDFHSSPGRPETSPLFTKHAQTEPTARSTMRRTASLDDPTDELELLEIDEDDIWEEEQIAVQARLAQKWKTSYSLGSRLINVGSTNGSGIDPRSSPKASQHIRLNVKAVSATPMPQHPVTKHAKQQTALSNPKPRISECHPSVRHNLQASAGLGPRMGSRSAPISIDIDDVSEETVCSSRGRLQAFRYDFLREESGWRATHVFDLGYRNDEAARAGVAKDFLPTGEVFARGMMVFSLRAKMDPIN